MYIYLKLTDVITFTWDDMHPSLETPVFKTKEDALSWLMPVAATVDNYVEIVEAIDRWIKLAEVELKVVHNSVAYMAYTVFLGRCNETPIRVGTARYYKDGSVYLHFVNDSKFLGKCDNLCYTVKESVSNIISKCN